MAILPLDSSLIDAEQWIDLTRKNGPYLPLTKNDDAEWHDFSQSYFEFYGAGGGVGVTLDESFIPVDSFGNRIDFKLDNVQLKLSIVCISVVNLQIWISSRLDSAYNLLLCNYPMYGENGMLWQPTTPLYLVAGDTICFSICLSNANIYGLKVGCWAVAPNGNIYRDTSSYSVLGTSTLGFYHGLFWFKNIDINRKSEINGSFIKFIVDQSSAGDLPCRIYAKAIGDSFPPFTTVDEANISEWTRNYIEWDISDDWISGQEVFTPDISSIIQEVVNRADWKRNNDILILVKIVTENIDEEIYRFYKSIRSSEYEPELFIGFTED